MSSWCTVRETTCFLCVNAILDVSKIEAGTYPIFAESFAFKEAVTMVHDMMAHQASQKGVTLCDRVSPRIGNVVADSRAIHQVLINLVSNAVKFTESRRRRHDRRTDRR